MSQFIVHYQTEKPNIVHNYVKMKNPVMTKHYKSHIKSRYKKSGTRALKDVCQDFGPKSTNGFAQ